MLTQVYLFNFVFTAGESQETLLSRSKRDLFGFADAIQCYNEDAIVAGYVDYGCFCGMGGGGIPLDETDKLVNCNNKYVFTIS